MAFTQFPSSIPTTTYNRNSSTSIDPSSRKRKRGHAFYDDLENRVSHQDPNAAYYPQSQAKVDRVRVWSLPPPTQPPPSPPRAFQPYLPQAPATRAFQPYTVTSAPPETKPHSAQLPFLAPLTVYDLDKKTEEIVVPLRQALNRLPSQRLLSDEMVVVFNEAFQSDHFKNIPILKNDLVSLFHLKAAYHFLKIENDLLDYNALYLPQALEDTLVVLKRSEDRLKIEDNYLWEEYEVFKFDEEGDIFVPDSVELMSCDLALRKAVILFLKSFCVLKQNKPATSENGACAAHKALYFLNEAEKLIKPYLRTSSKDIHESLSHLNVNFGILHREIATNLHYDDCYSSDNEPRHNGVPTYEKVVSRDPMYNSEYNWNST